jgi:hypothetical protein
LNSNSEIETLEKERIDLKLELDTIKSIQVEFVKHSKLTRAVDKIDNKIEKLQGI